MMKNSQSGSRKAMVKLAYALMLIATMAVYSARPRAVGGPDFSCESFGYAGFCSEMGTTGCCFEWCYNHEGVQGYVEYPWCYIC